MALNNITNFPEDVVCSTKYEAYQQFVEKGCCKNRCIQHITFRQVLMHQRNFRSKNEKNRRQYLLDFLYSQPNGVFGSFLFILDGLSVCRACWFFANDIKQAWFSNILRDVREVGRTDSSSSSTGRKRSVPSILAKDWLEKYAEESGDHAPDEKRIYLSSCMTKGEVYQLYKADMDDEENPIIKYETFVLMWRKDCGHITPRQNSKFSKCGVCELLREAEKSTMNAEFKEWLLTSKKRHVEQQQAERKVYYHHRKKAKDHPDHYCSIILDGMDQNKTNIPHFTAKSKSYKSEMYRVHITGAISHGTNQTFMFLDEFEWPHDSDQTMNIVLQTLRKVSKNGRLPPVLYIQMDNCWRENKNQYVLGLSALLVKKKIVKKVRLSYLMVGHTHEDIDQRFSRIAEALNHRDAVTIDDLKSAVEASFKPTPEVDSISCQYAIRDWLRQHLNPPKNHTKPHAYKFELDSKGSVVISYRMWASDKEWLGTIDLLRSVPDDAPPFSLPLFEKQADLSDMERDINSCSGKISLAQMDTWKKFLERGRRKRQFWAQTSLDQHCSSGKWLLSEFRRYRVPPKQPANLEADDNVRHEVPGAMLQKEQAVVKVTVTHQRREKDE